MFCSFRACQVSDLAGFNPAAQDVFRYSVPETQSFHSAKLHGWSLYFEYPQAGSYLRSRYLPFGLAK
jgi:hypothetical protein